ncbi:MAG: hypothetical protein KBT27_13295 [Prevotellaceae bacterium]|nr:hypothetical protein [Candidatus Faecinaster equi]
MNYIELAKTGNVGFVVKGIHYPDIRNFDIDLEGQLRIEYLELGNIGNGVSFYLSGVFNMLQHNLEHITIYLNTSAKSYQANINWLTQKAYEGVTVTAYDKDGNPIEIEVEE